MSAIPAADTPQEHIQQPWLERLGSLDVLLRAEGFPRGPDRWLNVHDLLARRAAAGGLPEDPSGLRPLLAPLFCRSPEEQTRFAGVFQRWLEQVAPPGETEPLTPKPPGERERRQSRRHPITAFWPYLVGMLVLLAGGGWLIWHLSKPPVVLTPPPLEKLPVSGPKDVPGTDAWQTLPLQPVPPRTSLEQPQPAAAAEGWLRLGDRLLPWIPALPGLAWLTWRWSRRRTVLRRRRDDAEDPFATITLEGMDDPLFDSPAVRAALRRLHAPVARPTRRLDVDRTVYRTVRNAGLFAPVFRDRQAVPELAVLVDYRHSADHMAGLGDLVVQRLREAGLEVHRYGYPGDPRSVHGPGGWLHLAEVADRHEGARLLLVAEPSALTDPWNARLQPWTEVFDLWPARALLATETPSAEWREGLEAAGFAVAPLTSAGLVSLSLRLAKAPAGQPPAPLPPSSLGDADAWTAGASPDRRHVISLLARLHLQLGGPGRLLLAAMAAYPTLHWGLTRALDLSLFPGGGAAGRELRLTRLAQLPWCREGRLPDWLRLALLRDLAPVQRERVSAVYRAMLDRASLNGAGGIELPLDLPPPTKGAGERWRRRLLPRGRRLGVWLRDLLGLAPEGSTLKDRIFANLLLGGRLGLLDFELPRRLALLLPGSRWARAVAPALLGLLVAVVGFWGVQEGWARWGRAAVERDFLDRQLAVHGEFQVEIVTAPGTEALEQALNSTLDTHGFGAVERRDWPVVQNKDGQFEPEGGPAENRVEYPPGANAVAGYLAGRLAYLSHGLTPELVEEPAGALPAGRLRVWLREPGRTGSVFRDRLDKPLDTGEWERIRSRLEEDETQQPKTTQESASAAAQPIEPEMIELPGGRFRMGCVSGKGCLYDEKPVHEVEIRPFAIGRYEVTFEEYDRFAEATGGKQPDDAGWGRGRRPVINVIWEDATAYAAWLSEKTGRRYRLPSEAEWEYAARAGTATEYWWGDEIGANRANCDGCGSRWDTKQTAPVGSFEPNPRGLHDTSGNVWEWTQDCWNPSYEGAPVDGSAWEFGDCAGRVVRGGSWNLYPEFVRSANRSRIQPDVADINLGFRLARTL